MWELDIGIPVDAPISPTTILGTNVFELQDEIEKAIGKRCHSSGCGFGYRDFQIPFETEEEAKVASFVATDILLKHGFKVRRQMPYDPEWTGAYVDYHELKEV